MIKRSAWNNLQVAERAMNALKENFEEKEMVWARSCIKRDGSCSRRNQVGR